jgi:hypothetical protein
MVLLSAPGMAAAAIAKVAFTSKSPLAVESGTRRDTQAFTVAWQLTGAVHCNKFQ